MKVLVIGSGGREHALVQKIARSPLVSAVYALPGNPGMREAACLEGDPMDKARTVRAALENGIGFCVVAPDDPLADGLVDALEAAGIPCFGPTRKAARLESSKVFSKRLMQKYGIPTAAFAAFDNLAEALKYLEGQPFPLVIKADGLARGKGVFIAEGLQEARDALHEIMGKKAFGASGSQVVIEEFLKGPEVSVLALTDGKTLVPLLSAMDHKRALDGDRGPNTGGMGVIAPSPFYTADIADACMKTVFQPTIDAMAREGCPFSGCLFFGLMLTQSGPKVLEYNARFGDPEAQAVLALMESDLLPALLACRGGSLREGMVRFRDGHSCCLVLTSKGYPGACEVGHPIAWQGDEAVLHFAGVAERAGQLVTAGGRVLGLTAAADTLEEAVSRCYRQAERVDFSGKSFRRDIGQKAMAGEGM